MQGTNGNPDAFGDGHIAGVLPVESQDSNSRLTVTEYLSEAALHGFDVLHHEFQGNKQACHNSLSKSLRVFENVKSERAAANFQKSRTPRMSTVISKFSQI